MNLNNISKYEGFYLYFSYPGTLSTIIYQGKYKGSWCILN